MLLYLEMSCKKQIYCLMIIYFFGVFCQNLVFASPTLSGYYDNISSGSIQNDEGVSEKVLVDIGFLGEKLNENNQDNDLLSGDFGQSGLVLDNSGVLLEEQENTNETGVNVDTLGQDVEKAIKTQNTVNVPILNNVDLLLSEVYFDGTDEWFEIFNLGDDLFLGDLVVSGAKSSNLLLEDIQINPGSYLIVGDKLDSNNFLQNSIVGQGLSIVDSRNIDIKVFYQDILLDDFFVGEDSVSAANDKGNTSFHKLSDTKEILMASDQTTINANEGYSVNPGILYNSGDLSSGEELTGGINTGVQNLPILKITEIFPYGEDVWFEITNISDNDFSGSLYISGFLSGEYDFDISIPKKSSKVLSNNERYFQDLDIVDFVSNPLQISVDSNLSLFLYYQENLLDSFYIDQTWLEYLDGFDSSFEKIGTGESWFTTYVGLNIDRYYNTNRGYAANPGIIFESAENIIDVTIARQQEPDPGLTGFDDICNDLDDTYLNISEYYVGDERYPMYLEIDILDDRMTDMFIGLYFSGEAITGVNPYFDFYNYYDREEDVFLIDFSSNKKILFSNEEFWYDEMQDALFNTGFGIQTGLLEIYGFDGEDFALLDVINISETQKTKSTYYDGQDFQCVQSFGDIDSFSPGFDKKYSKYFETIAIECPICRCGGGTRYVAEFNSDSEVSADISISSIKYFDEENQIIKIKNNSNQPINMRDFSLQILIGENKKASFQGNTAISKTITSFLGSYGLPKKDSCVNLMQNNEVIDRYCYATLSKPSEKDVEKINSQLNFRSELENTDSSTGGLNTGLDYSIQIKSILYDADGLDYNREKIELNLISGDKVDLNDCLLQIKKDNKSTNKKIDGILKFGSPQNFIGNYSFPNSTKDGKSVQVDLLCEDILLDTYKYDPNQEEIEEEELLEDLEKINSQIKIHSIVYDPEGSDIDNEIISLFLQTGEAIKLNKDFYLYFNNKKRYLNSKETISSGELLSITGNFQFPNTKETCVDLMYKEMLLDTYCYNPEKDLTLSGTKIKQYSGLEIKIISLTPNPMGKDTDGETIIFQSNQKVILDKNFYIKVNNSKKSLENIQLSQNQHTTVVKNFSLPNSSSCVYLYHGDVIMDKFCYSDPVEGQKFTENNAVLSSVDVGDFEILKKVKFQTFGDYICSTIYDQKISCRKLPYSKLSQTKEKQNGFYKSYLSSFQSYLSQSRPIIYYNTDVQKHFNLYREIDKKIKAGESNIIVNGKIYSINEYEQIYQEKYPDSVLDLLSNTISSKLSAKIKEFYEDSYKKFIQEKSNLSL